MARPGHSCRTAAGRLCYPSWSAPGASLRMPRRPRSSLDDLPDVRDGLTRVERIILYVLWETQRERGDRNVPTAMLYGRVVERIDIGVEEFQRILQKLVGVQGGHTGKRPNPFDGPDGGDDRN